MKSQTKLILIGAIFMILLSTIIVMAVFDDVDGPLIYEIDILPVSPVSGDYINVIAYCIDPSGISNAQLSSTTDGVEWSVQDMDFFTCLCLAGGRWVARFGPVTDNGNVAFFVTAIDNSPNLNPIDSQTFTIDIDTI